MESLKSSEEIQDSRTPKELALDIGIPELTLLSCSNVDPQKTALRVFNHIFPSNQDKELLINAATLDVEYPGLLKNILSKLSILNLAFVSCLSFGKKD